MKEQWSMSKEKIICVEEGLPPAKDIEEVKLVWAQGKCERGLQVIKFILYLDLILFIGWVCYSVMMQLKVMENLYNGQTTPRTSTPIEFYRYDVANNFDEIVNATETYDHGTTNNQHNKVPVDASTHSIISSTDEPSPLPASDNRISVTEDQNKEPSVAIQLQESPSQNLQLLLPTETVDTSSPSFNESEHKNEEEINESEVVGNSTDDVTSEEPQKSQEEETSTFNDNYLLTLLFIANAVTDKAQEDSAQPMNVASEIEGGSSNVSSLSEESDSGWSEIMPTVTEDSNKNKEKSIGKINLKRDWLYIPEFYKEWESSFDGYDEEYQDFAWDFETPRRFGAFTYRNRYL
ncbi:uncharacterized protein LOC143185960 [Calliopsis andreniformis]|uniref:uncharacterized protein LOC143185960 n=1 Tax=Calliopsis andreniformis TaxID=337506 RepID=UPI003FCD115B